MQTAMGCALAEAGLISNEQANQELEAIPDHLKQYTHQIQEIKRLTTLFTQSGVEFSLLDIATLVAFDAMLRREEYADAYKMMLSRLKKVASKNGLV